MSLMRLKPQNLRISNGVLRFFYPFFPQILTLALSLLSLVLIWAFRQAVGLSAISFSASPSSSRKKDAAPIPHAKGLRVMSCELRTRLLTTHSSWRLKKN